MGKSDYRTSPYKHTHVLYLLRVRPLNLILHTHTHKTTLSLNSGKISQKSDTPDQRVCEQSR